MPGPTDTSQETKTSKTEKPVSGALEKEGEILAGQVREKAEETIEGKEVAPPTKEEIMDRAAMLLAGASVVDPIDPGSVVRDVKIGLENHPPEIQEFYPGYSEEDLEELAGLLPDFYDLPEILQRIRISYDRPDQKREMERVFKEYLLGKSIDEIKIDENIITIPEEPEETAEVGPWVKEELTVFLNAISHYGYTNETITKVLSGIGEELIPPGEVDEEFREGRAKIEDYYDQAYEAIGPFSDKLVDRESVDAVVRLHDGRSGIAFTYDGKKVLVNITPDSSQTVKENWDKLTGGEFEVPIG